MYRVHHFDSSQDAYDAALDGRSVRENDVLVVSTEGVVGLASTHPIAVTVAAGALHALTPMTREEVLAELVHGAVTIRRAVDEALRHHLPVAPSYLDFAGWHHQLLPSEANVTLRLDDITAISDAIDHRLSGFEQLSGTIDPQSSRGLFLASAIERLRAARERLGGYTKGNTAIQAVTRPL